MKKIKVQQESAHLHIAAGAGDHTQIDIRYQFGKNVILCEGDSWTSVGELSWKPSNLVTYWTFPEKVLAWNLSEPGDTLAGIVSRWRSTFFRSHLNGPEELTTYRAIFLSVGGNDLIDWAPKIIVPSSRNAGKFPQNYIKTIELERLFDSLLDGFRWISDQLSVSRYNKETPIIVHCYDYPTPRACGAGPNFGPWLQPVLKNAEVPEDLWVSVSEYLIDELARFYYRIQREKIIEHFFVIGETLGSLTPAKTSDSKESKHWANEIHPNEEGYKILGPIVSQRIQEIAFS